jgi:hypothetical protein
MYYSASCISVRILKLPMRAVQTTRLGNWSMGFNVLRRNSVSNLHVDVALGNFTHNDDMTSIAFRSSSQFRTAGPFWTVGNMFATNHALLDKST